jgi:hypothetical protein
METLIFHGAPPMRPAPTPGSFPSAKDESGEGVVLDMRSSELVDDDSSAGLANVDARETPEAPPQTARSGRPPANPTRRVKWQHVAWVAAAGLTIAWHVMAARAEHERLAPKAPPPATTAATPPAHGGSPATGPLVVAPRAEGCAVAGPARLLARRALVRGGVEVSSADGRIGVGVMTGAREGSAFELDASSLAVKSSAKVIAPEPLRRVLPALSLSAPLDVLVDSSATRSLVDADDNASIAARDGYLVWGSREEHDQVRLWRLDGGGAIESPRLVALGATGDRVVTFRRNGAIWIGAFRATEASAALGPLARASDGAQVGSPSIDARGGEAIVAWAQRDGAAAPWTVRWMRWRPGVLIEKPRALVLPPGGPGERAIAPSVAALDGGRFLLAWTEGAASRHQVRAQAFDEGDRPWGEAFDVSPPGSIAGQEQIAMADGSTGAVAFLSGRGRGFELVAAPIACRAQ